MYAVLVIAAILLSVAPMHVRTILATLPGTPGHQFAPEQFDQQSLRTESSATRQATHPARAIYAPAIHAALPPAPVAAVVPRIPAASLGLLEHAPNAP